MGQWEPLCRWYLQVYMWLTWCGAVDTDADV